MAVITCPNCGAKNRVDPARGGRERAVCGRCHRPLPVEGAAGKPVDLTDATFASFLASAGDRPVLVDCWAPWCGPCRMLAPTIDGLAADAEGRYLVGKLNTDENPETAGRFQISSIPTLLIVKRGALVDRLVGVQPRQAIAATLAAHQ